MTELVFDRLEKNIVGKGENAGYQHYLLCQGHLKLGLCSKGLNLSEKKVVF